MSAIKLATPSSGSISLSPADTASNLTITVPAVTGTMLTTASTFAGTGPAFSAYLNSSQSVTNGVETKVTLNGEDFDTNSNFDSTTNYRFTPTVAGYYQINGTTYPSTATTNTIAAIWKNGARYKWVIASGSNPSSSVSCVVYLNGSTDYIELYITLFGTTPSLTQGIPYNSLSGALVRAA